MDEMNVIVAACAQYLDIKVVAEACGVLTWSVESEREDVTRVVTPSCFLWPS